jgi:hypothetical protein
MMKTLMKACNSWIKQSTQHKGGIKRNIQKLTGTLKAESQIISRHHQSSVDHDVIVS